jgi:3'-5' exoribonuclease
MSESQITADSTKRIFVADIQAGDKVEDIFFLAAKNVAHKKDGNAYLNITVADRSGQIKGVVWDQVEKLTSAANSGDFVRISAAAGEYRGTLQLVVKAITRVPSDQITPSDYLPATSRNVDQMFDRLKSLTDTIASLPLKSLIMAFWQDQDFVDRFKKSPAAKKMHHAYLGGLLEHTLSMVLLVDKIAGHYSGVDRDLLMVGAMLHDIGKVRELSYDFGIDYTDEGRLLSHIVIALDMVEEKIRALGAFPEDLAVMVKHLIISHHGAREFGSPEPPKTIEAVLLNYIDEIDSRVNGIREFMAAEDPSAQWTSYHRLLERHFFKGNPNQ